MYQPTAAIVLTISIITAAVLARVGLYSSLACFAVRSMASSSGEHVGHGSHGGNVPAAAAPPPPPGPLSIHEWAKQPHPSRPQKRKPPWDKGRWHLRSNGSKQMVNNHRKMLRYILQLCLNEHDKLTAESTAWDTRIAFANLENSTRSCIT